MELIDGMTATDGMVFGPTINEINNNLMIEFNAQPVWSNQVNLWLYDSGNTAVDVTVDWGDGNTQYVNTSSFLNYTYASSGTYFIEVSGNSLGYFRAGADGVIGVSSWGNLQIVDMHQSFAFCSNLTYVPNNLPTTVTNTASMFNSCYEFNDSNISFWNTSNVFNMSEMFYSANTFNQNLNGWNTSAVTDLSFMFFDATNFNGNIESWNTGNVTDLNYMFTNAQSFNSNIGNWNTVNVTSMYNMFQNAISFDANIGPWNVINVQYMDSMFEDATIFNQDLTSWCVVKIDTEPYGFALNCPLDPNYYPSWGTCASNPAPSSAPMILTFDSSAQTTVGLTFTGSNVNVLIDWGDGNTSQTIGNGFTKSHTYDTSNIYTITAYGEANGLINDYYTGSDGIISVDSWGDLIGFNSLYYTLAGASNLVSVPTSIPANITNTEALFYECSIFNDANIMSWNTGNITDMSSMFYNATNFNQNIGSWNTSSVTNMAGMFTLSTNFNQNIGGWDTGNVIGMSGMFSGANVFNQDIGNWNTGNVTFMYNMFLNAKSFNQDIGGWNTGNVIGMSAMFSGANVFNQNINSWNTENVQTMSSMFDNAYSFNQSLNSWNTINVEDMSAMFSNAHSFNGVISSWDTSNVTDMSYMFSRANSFNQNIISWDTSSVANMYSMFSGATVFNQEIGGWDTGNVVTIVGIFNNASSFNGNISTWDMSKLPAFVYYGVTPVDFAFTNATSFNQNLSTWCVPNIHFSGYPNYFDNGATSWTLPRPLFGICPETANLQSLVFTVNPTYGNVVINVGSNNVSNSVLLIDWGDGTTQNWYGDSGFGGATMNHNYSGNMSTKTVSIKGRANYISFGSTYMPFFGAGSNSITSLDSWGPLLGLEAVFFNNCRSLTSVPSTLPNNFTNLNNVFRDCTSFNSIAVTSWDTSNVVTMGNLFAGASIFNQNLSGWCVTNITTEPVNFSTGSALSANNKPVWGTCPP